MEFIADPKFEFAQERQITRFKPSITGAPTPPPSAAVPPQMPAKPMKRQRNVSQQVTKDIEMQSPDRKKQLVSESPRKTGPHGDRTSKRFDMMLREAHESDSLKEEEARGESISEDSGSVKLEA